MSDDGTGNVEQAATAVVGRQAREPQWRERVAAWRASGQTQAAYCREHGLTPAELSWWKHELARRDQALKTESSPTPKPTKTRRAFIPVRISPSPAREGFELVLRGGHTIRMGASFDEAGLRRLLAVLENSRC